MVVSVSFANSFAAKFLHELRRCCGPEQVTTRNVSWDAGPQTQTLRSLLRAGRPGGIVALSLSASPAWIAECRAEGLPVVVIDESVLGAATIVTDNTQGGRLAASHLLARGYRRLGLLSGQTNVPGSLNAKQRCAGFSDTLLAAGLRVTARHEVVSYLKTEGFEAFPYFARCDAVFCAAGDECACGMVAAAKKARMAIPKDIAIIGYDDHDLAQIVQPNLTTIRQPVAEMARAAFVALTSDRARTLSRPGPTTFQPELIEREST